MSFRIKPLPSFQRQAKRLLKKFKSLEKELRDLNKLLEENPTQGMVLGQNCYKIRLAIRSKKAGKSGGSRVVTHVRVEG
jgi:mRNA-degrading endonuclease RelE of RelBE toxin-antitoxin system